MSAADDLDLAFRAYQAGDFAVAVASCERVLAQAPAEVPALQILSLVRFAERRPADALELAHRAIAANPDDPDSHSNLGLMLLHLGRHDEAVSCCDRALALAPQHVAALVNRGNTLWALNRIREAVVSYDRALAVHPNYIDALINRANASAVLRHLNEAISFYDKALALDANHAEALYGRAAAFGELDRHDEALADLERLLAVAPHHPYARGAATRRAQEACDWRPTLPSPADIEADIRAGRGFVAPFAFLAISSSPEAQLACTQAWMHQRYPAVPRPLWQGERYGHNKVRVAYISADFREHPTSHLIVGCFERHDRQRFETTAISFGPDDGSPIRSRVAASVDRFVDVRARSDAEVARLLRELEIDIAVDLMGVTADCRPGLLAHRPAPVQASYLGFAGTTAAPFIDYIIGDRWVIPQEQQAFYTEKVVYVPDTYQVTDNTRAIAAEIPTRTALGLPETDIVFCCFNVSYKIAPHVFDIWMRLLRTIDGSVLWLLDDNPAAVRNLRDEALRRGVAPERLVFAPRVASADHLARHTRADLALDTLPYNGHTVTSDALWAGVPVVTCLGTAFAGRVAASLLDAAGLPELITRSLSDYEALVLRLATDREALAGIKAKLAANRVTSPLFDTDRFTRHLESAYASMRERTQRGQPPAAFAVEPLV